MEQRFGYSLEKLARRFDRSVSWVSRRLALAELLPEAIQQQVREDKIAAQVAMKFLVRWRGKAWRAASAWQPFSPSITARRARPVRRPPKPLPLPAEVWINKPPPSGEKTKEGSQ
jgi:hypothetical protein